MRILEQFGTWRVDMFKKYFWILALKHLNTTYASDISRPKIIQLFLWPIYLSGTLEQFGTDNYIWRLDIFQNLLSFVNFFSDFLSSKFSYTPILYATLITKKLKIKKLSLIKPLSIAIFLLFLLRITLEWIVILHLSIGKLRQT